MRHWMFLLLVLSSAYAFTIESYESYADVQNNGDIYVFERISFDLEQQYEEGYRSIRPADVENLDNLIIHSVKVNGKDAGFYKQVNGDNVEIVWTETTKGINNVEIAYTLKDRVELFNDYARVCFEHFGAGWSVPAEKFSSRISLPEESRGKEVHFQIYSAKEPQTYIDSLSIGIKMEDVPPGNYIGGCYLFARDSVNTTRIVNASAYDILENERASYGSETLLAPSWPPTLICMPAFIISILIAAKAYLGRRKPKYDETILPPDSKEPAAVAALVKNSYNEKDLLAATILSLINRRFIDIVELEKKGETSLFAKRERTVLMLRKRKGLKPHEQAVVNMIFFDKKDVELDELAKEFKKVRKREDAKKHHVTKNFEEFSKEIKAVLRKDGVWSLANRHRKRIGMLGGLGIGALFLFMIGGSLIMPPLFYGVRYYLVEKMWTDLASILLSLVLSPLMLLYAAGEYLIPKAPKEHREEFERWDAFARSLKSSRIKDYPPSSVVIWGNILVYATPLGMADKVKAHLSELDDLVVKRIEKMMKINRSSYRIYSSAALISTISKSHSGSGFSTRSSGGWSSGGGGGFSSGSSGGGGFR